jgi:hypothetical protein
MVYRNKQPFWYSLYNRTVVDTDTHGNRRTYTTYNTPVKVKGNISAAVGDVMTRQFGDDVNYDKVIVLGDRDTPIDENAVLWIDREPSVNLWGELTVNANGDYVTPWDYIVRKVGRGLPNGSAVIAVSKVNVS